MERDIDIESFRTIMRGNLFHIMAQNPEDLREHFEIVLHHKPNSTGLLNERDELGRTPLHDAADAGNVELTRLFIQHGADPKIQCNKGLTPFMCGIISARADVSDFYVDYIDKVGKSLLDMMDKEGRTAFMIVLHNGEHLRFGLRLMGLGCDYMHKDKNGLTGIEHIAIRPPDCEDCSINVLWFNLF